jgi:hypothetical protein
MFDKSTFRLLLQCSIASVASISSLVCAQQVAPMLGASAPKVAVVPGAAHKASAQAASAPKMTIFDVIQPGAKPGSIASNAPTIGILSQLQRQEIERAAIKRLDALSPPPNSAPIAQTPPSVDKPAGSISMPGLPGGLGLFSQPKVPPVDASKRVIAIYGLSGFEIAEILMPNGAVIKGAPGVKGDGFSVLKVEKGRVVVEVSPKLDAQQDGKKKKSGKVNDADQPAPARIISVPVGGKFE